MPATASAPYFDGDLGAWILSRYADVAEALRDPRLIPGADPAAAPADPVIHAEFRSQALRALAPETIYRWESQFAALADRMAAGLPSHGPVDLMEAYANPWSLAVAGLAAEVPEAECGRLAGLARAVFASACDPLDRSLGVASREATVELGRHFQSAPAWQLQMFVALAHSLPAFLGNAWLALLENRAELQELRENPALMPAAIEELLRVAGPAKALFRHTAAGERTILQLDLANRDPKVFPEPDKLEFSGRSRGHLAFGAGGHACIGAAMIHRAAGAATRAVLDRLGAAADYAADPVDSLGMRYLRSLGIDRALCL